MAIVKVACSDCGMEYPKRTTRRGICPKCRSWRRKHGMPRPKDAATHQQPTDKCQNCGDMTPGIHTSVKGLCKRCYQYKWRTGKDRPIRIVERTAHLCQRCKKKEAVHSGRCPACYQYLRRHGVERPLHKTATKCIVCKTPTNRDDPETRNFGGLGMCVPCYNYWRRHGKRRPSQMWSNGRYGYCDCGKPATHKATITVHRHAEEMPLCDDCYAEHQRQVAWYGDGKPTGNLQEGKRIISGDD